MVTKKVHEVMIPLKDYPHISYWDSLLEAVEKIENSQIVYKNKSSLPRLLLVFGKDGDLVGTLRRRDILRALEPKFLVKQSRSFKMRLFSDESNEELTPQFMQKIMDEVMELSKQPVSQVMAPVGQIIDSNESLFNAIYEMNINKSSMLPVIHEGEIIGVIRTVDVFHEIAQSMLGRD